MFYFVCLGLAGKKACIVFCKASFCGFITSWCFFSSDKRLFKLCMSEEAFPRVLRMTSEFLVVSLLSVYWIQSGNVAQICLIKRSLI